jgi:hypothetical protein
MFTRLEAADLRAVVEAASGVRFVMVGQPWPGQALVEAQLGLRAETLEGWPLDAVVAEFAAAGNRMDAATGLRVRGLTAGMPLYVQNAAWVTQTAYGGDAARFCAAVEQPGSTLPLTSQNAGQFGVRGQSNGWRALPLLECALTGGHHRACR